VGAPSPRSRSRLASRAPRPEWHPPALTHVSFIDSASLRGFVLTVRPHRPVTSVPSRTPVRVAGVAHLALGSATQRCGLRPFTSRADGNRRGARRAVVGSVQRRCTRLSSTRARAQARVSRVKSIASKTARTVARPSASSPRRILLATRAIHDAAHLWKGTRRRARALAALMRNILTSSSRPVIPRRHVFAIGKTSAGPSRAAHCGAEPSSLTSSLWLRRQVSPLNRSHIPPQPPSSAVWSLRRGGRGRLVGSSAHPEWRSGVDLRWTTAASLAVNDPSDASSDALSRRSYCAPRSQAANASARVPP